MDKFNVKIGIQARSTSERLPNKVSMLLGKKSILQHVIAACDNSTSYINSFSRLSGITATTYILIPKGDRLKNSLTKTLFVEGDENDVLSRYVLLQESTNADYIVRITSDCPLIPSFLITKLIYICIKKKYDYISNVDARVRTYIDGFDIEVISKKALGWLKNNVVEDTDKEHVTTLLRHLLPKDLSMGTIIGHIDLSDVKLSVDTKEDYMLLQHQFNSIQNKLVVAKQLYGVNHVHRV